MGVMGGPCVRRSREDRRGRHPRAEAPSEPFQIRLSPAERQRLALAAALNHQTLTEFCRIVLLNEAETCLEGTAESLS